MLPLTAISLSLICVDAEVMVMRLGLIWPFALVLSSSYLSYTSLSTSASMPKSKRSKISVDVVPEPDSAAAETVLLLSSAGIHSLASKKRERAVMLPVMVLLGEK